MSLLEVTGLRTEIDTPQGRIRPVDGVSFSVEAGQTLGVVGESGSGKTMTGMSIMRLLPAGGSIAAGSIRLNDHELTSLDEPAMRKLRGSELAMIFQDPMTSLNPVRTIGSQLREAYRIHVDAGRAASTARATDVLGLVGMPRPRERLDDYPHQLSGGMRQRVMIALGLMCEPKLLIADEPTTALDVSIQAQILTLIDDLKEQLSMGVLLITHDMGVIAEYADRVAVMYGGQMVEQSDVHELFKAPRHRYTEALLAAMPTLELDRNAELATIPGSPPKLLDLAPGCRFAARCAFAQEDCRRTDPPSLGDGHLHACFHPADGSGSAAAVQAPTTFAKEPGGADALVQLFEVHKRFRVRSKRPFAAKRAVQAVSGVTLTIAAGETLGIVGESGCGKTTLGRMLVGLERPTSGSVSFDGRDLSAQTRTGFRKRRRDLQMMFQDSAAALDPRMTVAALIAEPLVAQGVGTRRERRQAVGELLEAVGLPPEAAERYPHEFSGGQRQRIAMARALALRPKVIVADEPVSALDVSVQAQILNLMRSLQERYGQTYVVISHDLSLLKYLADRIGVMYLGRLVELGAGEDVYNAPRHPYTAGLIEAIPVPESAKNRAAGTRSTGLGGELPSAIDPPSGCHFRTRCPLATERCATEVPVLRPSDGLHAVACHHPLTSQVLTPAR